MGAGVVMLEDDTKMQLEVLFGMIDRDLASSARDDFVRVALEQVHGLQRHSSHETVTRPRPLLSRHRSSTHVTTARARRARTTAHAALTLKVDQAATTALMQREVLHKWKLSARGGLQRRRLRGEFINGMKRTAMKLAPGAECFTAVDQPIALADGTAAQAILKASHHDMLMLLNESINNAVKNLCKELFDFFNSCGADARAFARVQAARCRQPAQVGVLAADDRRAVAVGEEPAAHAADAEARGRARWPRDAATVAAAAASGSGVAPIPAASRALPSGMSECGCFLTPRMYRQSLMPLNRTMLRHQSAAPTGWRSSALASPASGGSRPPGPVLRSRA